MEGVLRARRANDEIKLLYTPKDDPLDPNTTYHFFAWVERSSRAADGSLVNPIACALKNRTALEVYTIPFVHTCTVKLSSTRGESDNSYITTMSAEYRRRCHMNRGYA
jgi:hypothetical protein